MSKQTIELIPQPLTAEAFRPFGDVIEATDAYELINSGTTRKFADLAKIDVSAEGGRPCISIYRATPYKFPLRITLLECHPLGSQLFMPLHGEPFIVVVAPAGEVIDALGVRAFRANGGQGVNYDRGTWHHPLIALSSHSEFLVIDRTGSGANCKESSCGSKEIKLLLDRS